MRRAVTATLVALSLASFSAAPAEGSPTAVPVGCGATVATDAYLTSDLDCTGEFGVFLVGSVTLDLRGHRLTGHGDTDRNVGVVWDAGREVTITNGTIDGWRVGIADSGTVELPGGTAGLGSATVTKVDLQGGIAVSAWNDVRYLVDRSRITGGSVSLRLADMVMRRTHVSDGHVATSMGDLQIEDSVLVRASAGATEHGSLVVTGSVFKDAPYTAVSGDESGPITVRRSTFRGNRVGVGTGAPGGGGVIIEDSTFIQNGTAVSGGATGMTITGNRFVRNDEAVRIGALPWDLPFTITGNELLRNGQGLVVEAAASVGDNRALHNAGWGINAPRATDLGGNQAWGNGTEPQCVGVVCGGPGRSGH